MLSHGGAGAPPLTAEEAARHISTLCGLASPAPSVGAEVEWLVVDAADPQARATVEQLRSLLGTEDLPGGSRITFEPGGQLELSGPPAGTPDDAVTPLQLDHAEVSRRLEPAGLALAARAHDGVRLPHRVNHEKRYDSMEAWFLDGGWTTAGEMMCNTAAVQVNVGCGPDPATTWQRANRLAPVFAAMFAASPSDGWASGRLRAWAGLDPSRTDTALLAGDPVADWVAYAMRARAMLRWNEDEICRADGKFTFGEWVEGAPAAPAPPSIADLDLHLSTLFPPVRLKGWIEVRVVDIPAGDGWPVPVAVVASILCGAPGTGEERLGGMEEGPTWQTAGRLGLGSPELQEAARLLVADALDGLRATGSGLVEQVSDWADRCLGSSAKPPAAGFQATS
jgi:glutamate--cysteine ligase